jgi:hypothetical protein
MSEDISIYALAANENFRRIYDGVFAPSGGMRLIRHSMSVKEFDEDLEVRRAEAQAVANMIDFSYRYSKHPLTVDPRKMRKPAGANRAQYMARSAYHTNMNKSTMKTRWRDYKRPAVFLYLLLKHGFALSSPALNKKHFVLKLLTQVDNVDEIKKDFRPYQMVREAVVKQGGYEEQMPALKMDLNCQDPPLATPEFSPEIKEVFKKSLADSFND